nr:integrase, catalytic region, zinc finger, CCHC-type, peptidase aspartic, catalytic [Tanacetum cinerariifolium]
MNSEELNLSTSTTIVEVPKELPKVSMVNSSLKKLKFHLASFDMIVKEITTATSITEGTVTKLVAENKHLKQTYKKLYDSIKSSRVRSKEQCDALIKQVNIKSAKNYDLNASLQEKVLVITALKDNLSKLKGKAVVNEAVTLHSIDQELLKIDVAPLAPKLRNNRTAHNDYLKHTQEKTATLREIVENERLLNPVNTSLDYACKYTKRIQELLIILKQTYPCINDLGTKLMVVTPINNNNKRIRFTEHIPSSGNSPIKTISSTNVVQIVLWYLDSGCSKHMTGHRSQLINFVQKFLGTVKFKNDHVAKIMGYGDYKIRNVTISSVYFVKGLGHNLFSGLVRGLPKHKFEKDHLCSACEMGKIEVPKELPKVNMVNSSLKKLKFHLACFDMVVKERTTATSITEGTWGFQHTKAYFRDEIIPFVKALKELFNSLINF